MQACSLTQSLPLAMVPHAGNTVVKSFPQELEVRNVKTLRGHGISERVTNPNGSSEYIQPPAGAVCRGPAPAGSRGTLRMNGVGEKRREKT